jgi:predicted nucleic acid-binding protein
MILADTSVWIDHLRQGDPALIRALNTGIVFTHPFVIGEIALGSVRNRNEILDAMRDLPIITIAEDTEVQLLIERQPLHGIGIGYIDAHLLASTQLTPGARLWTRDKRLHGAADRMGIAARVDN